jgi:hypothetical protein
MAEKSDQTVNEDAESVACHLVAFGYKVSQQDGRQPSQVMGG